MQKRIAHAKIEGIEGFKIDIETGNPELLMVNIDQGQGHAGSGCLLFPLPWR
jgi:hypothetical protein